MYPLRNLRKPRHQRPGSMKNVDLLVLVNLEARGLFFANTGTTSHPLKSARSFGELSRVDACAFEHF